MAKTNNIHVRSTESTTELLKDLSAKLGKTQASTIKLALELLDSAIECKELVKQGDTEKEILFARLTLNRFR